MRPFSTRSLLSKQHNLKHSQRNPPQNHQQGPTRTNGGLSPGLVLTAVAGYASVVNAGAFSLFAYDKYQATHRKWRIPEKTLILTSLVGGWIGGLLAMNLFRHKTVKKSFQTSFFAAMGGNLLMCVAGVFVLKRSNPIVWAQLQKRLGIRH